EISVKDDGAGIDPEILPAMFESFTSAKPGGMGIGLSICRAIVEAHGGHISAWNNPEGGATLCFTLPVEPQGGDTEEADAGLWIRHSRSGRCICGNDAGLDSD